MTQATYNRMTDMVVLIKKDGARYDSIKASVQPDLIITSAVNVPFEVDDTIERELPSTLIERYTIVEPNFYQGQGNRFPHFQLKVKRQLSPPPDAIPAPSKIFNIFLCHGKEDKITVRRLYDELKAAGYEPWFDEENIAAGQDWQFEIRKAVRKADAVLVCLSASSCNRSGVIQKEITQALDVAEEKPQGSVYIIPVLLGQCDVPERLTKYQYLHLNNSSDVDRLLRDLAIHSQNSK